MTARPIRIDNAILFDGETHFPRERYSVRIEGGRIVELATTSSVKPDADAFDADGKTLLPGLIDAHFHCNSPKLNIAAADRLSPSHMAQYARHYLESSLQRGFTTLRDAGGADAGLKQAVAEGLIAGPRLFIAGAALSQTGGHGDMRDGVPPCGCAGYSGSLSRVVDGVESVRLAVREELRRGADQIKIFVSGGVLSPTDPIWMDQFTDEEIEAAVEEAARRRTYVMAHAHTANAVARCAQLGVRSIEHGTQMDRPTADIVAKAEAYLVPTLQVVTVLGSGRVALPGGALEKVKQITQQAVDAIMHAHAAGIRVGLGTDLLGELHGDELRELELRAGISGTLETLRSATSINAEILQMRGELGCIAPGAIADIILLDGDPLADMRALSDEGAGRVILKDGVVVRDDFGFVQGSFGRTQ